jgi:vancomycin resistance protein VanW
VYNYLDYRFHNPTEDVFQLLIHTEEDQLCGELRCGLPLAESYHIREENAFFTEEDGIFYRHNQIWRKRIDKETGRTIEDRLLLTNHARVCYDRALY